MGRPENAWAELANSKHLRRVKGYNKLEAASVGGLSIFRLQNSPPPRLPWEVLFLLEGRHFRRRSLPRAVLNVTWLAGHDTPVEKHFPRRGGGDPDDERQAWEYLRAFELIAAFLCSDQPNNADATAICRVSSCCWRQVPSGAIASRAEASFSWDNASDPSDPGMASANVRAGLSNPTSCSPSSALQKPTPYGSLKKRFRNPDRQFEPYCF